MKNILIILLVIICNSYSLFAQTEGTRFVYHLTFQLDSTDVKSKRQELFYLDIFRDEQYFVSEYRYKLDSVLLNPSVIDINQFASNPSSRPKPGKFPFILQFKDDSLKYHEKVIVDNHAYVEKTPALDWIITSETKDIGGYLCQKSTTSFVGRDYTAWYTTQIPL